MKKLKAISIFALCFALLFSSTITASAAQSSKAATLRLEKTQGTVTVTNASGTSKKATQNMKLLSGYTVSTGKASYAYISLDSSKALKLDASSKVSIHKAGKKLEVKVVSGKVMFNVSAPLTSQESLTIRTSTMVTGVRGTAGWFESDQTSSAVYLLEGSLDVYSTGRSKPTNITSGQQMTSQAAAAPGTSDTPTTPDGSGSTGETEVPAEVKVESFTTAEVPGFVAAAVAEDTSLQNRMQDKGSPIDAAAVASVAEEKLKQDETAAAKQDQQIQQQEKESTAEAQKNQQSSNNTLFENNKPAAPSTPVYVPSTPAPTPEPVPSSIELTDPSQKTLQDALNYYDIVKVSFTVVSDIPTEGEESDVPEEGTDMIEPLPCAYGGLIVPEGKLLKVCEGQMTITLPDENDEEPDYKSSFDVRGTVEVMPDAVLSSNEAGIIIFPSGELIINGMYDSYGTINITGKLTVNSEMSVKSYINIISYSDLCKLMEIEDDLMVDFTPVLTVGEDGNLTVDNSIINYGWIVNHGTIMNNNYICLEAGMLKNEEGSEFFNNIDARINVGSKDIDGKAQLIFSASEVNGNGSPAVNAGIIEILPSNHLIVAKNASFSNLGNIYNNIGGFIRNEGYFFNNVNKLVLDAETLYSGNINNDGQFENLGEFHNLSNDKNIPAITNNGEFFNSVVDEEGNQIGVGYIENSAIINNFGKFFNNVVNEDTDSEHYYKICNSGIINNSYADEGDETGIFENHSTLINTDGGVISNSATLRNNTGGELKNEGTINNNGRFENRSTLINVNKGIIDNHGEFMNSVVDGSKQLGVGYLDNSATINNYGKFFNIIVFDDTDSEHYYKIKNSGIINNIRTNVADTETGIFENDSTLINTANGTINNSGFFGNGSNNTNSCIQNTGNIYTSNEFKNLATLINNHSIINTGKFFNNIVKDGKPYGNGNIQNNGTITNTVDGQNTGIFEDKGSFNGNAVETP